MVRQLLARPSHRVVGARAAVAASILLSFTRLWDNAGYCSNALTNLSGTLRHFQSCLLPLLPTGPVLTAHEAARTANPTACIYAQLGEPMLVPLFWPATAYRFYWGS